jgi:hypothetical protein
MAFDHLSQKQVNKIQRGRVLENYLPIVVFIFLGIAFGIVPMLIGYWLGPSATSKSNKINKIATK